MRLNITDLQRGDTPPTMGGGPMKVGGYRDLSELEEVDGPTRWHRRYFQRECAPQILSG